jgi:glutamate racemase
VKQRRPNIGVFDSGMGGLTVLRALARAIPEADYLYFGDTARLPYGSKSPETVARYATGAGRFLEQRGAEMLVIACNTATALALDKIAESVEVPVIGVVEPGAQRAAAVTRSGKVVVIATEATIGSHAYYRALQRREVEACEKACPLLVPLVEEGWTDHPVTEQVARIYLDEAFATASAADVLVLGCTHYPLLKPLLKRVVRPGVEIVDSAESTADAVRELLDLAPLPPPSSGPERRHVPRYKFFVTDSVEKFRRLGERFLGLPVTDASLIDIEREPVAARFSS